MGEAAVFVLKEILKFQYIILPSIVISVMGLDKRGHFWWRAAVSVLVYILLSNLIYNLLLPVRLFGYIDPSYILMIALAVGCAFFCFRASVKTLVFFVVAAYAVQNAAYNVLYMIITLAGVEYRGTAGLWIQFGVYVFSYILYYFLFIRRLKNADDIDWDNRLIITIASLTLVVVYVLSSFFTTLLEGKESALIIVSRCYALTSCLLELVLQRSLCDKHKQEQENKVLERLLAQEEKQHIQSKENIELINRKCHDMKHQLAALRAGNASIDKDFIEEMENAVKEYDCNIHTGNSSLDIILTEKSLYCKKHNIKFGFILDGEAMSFMKDSDLYSLLGNALSNAIESVLEEADEEKRIIDMNISRKKDFIRIHIENYCPRTIKFENGLPVTTKQDKDYHGFGVKSIRYITEKYGGTLSIGQEDSMFYLNILFPQQSTKE